MGALGAASNEGQRVDFFAVDHSPLEREGLHLHILPGAQPRATPVGDFAAFYERLDNFSSNMLQPCATARTHDMCHNAYTRSQR